ncbi:MAG: alcohol dehydrogenase, partial [Eubacteriaceae bacterium]|nr:alcohol dehydrogenase [Eubacteriaceae bacterium]
GFYDLPHGVANAVLLPHVVAYNADAVGDRLKDVAVAMGLDISRREPKEINVMAIDAIKKLSKDVGIPAGLAELGVKEEDFPTLADLALADACTPGNPKCPSKEDIIAIYKSAF